MKLLNSDLHTILEKDSLKKGIEQYQSIRNRLYATNITEDTEFQNDFRTFYQMRRFYSDEFARHYFLLLEQLKYTQNISFEMAMERVKHIQGTYEMSFASKLAHTINPTLPIWDSVVTKHFGVRAPYSKSKDREQACCKRYEEFKEMMYRYMKSEEGREIIRQFDLKYPDSGLTDIKKIDFVLWQDRDSNNAKQRSDSVTLSKPMPEKTGRKTIKSIKENDPTIEQYEELIDLLEQSNELQEKTIDALKKQVAILQELLEDARRKLES